MALTEYSTGALVRVVADEPQPAAHLLDTYFPNEITFKTEAISFDTDDSKPRITPLVSPLVEGKVVDQEGFTTSTLKPAYAKDLRRVDPNDAFKRAIGERIGGGDIDPQARMDAALQRAAANALGMLTMREHVMASEGLRTGKVTLSGEGFKTVLVDFGRKSSNTITLSGNDRWSINDAASDPMSDLETWSALVDGGGTEVTMEPTAWTAMRVRLQQRGEDISLLGTLRGGNSSLDLGPQSRQDSRVNFIGTLGRFRISTFQAEYIDDTGTTQNLMPAGTVIMGSPALIEGTRHYGAIRDVEAGLQAMRYFPKTWTTPNPSAMWYLLQSAPLVAPYRPNATLCATVL